MLAIMYAFCIKDYELANIHGMLAMAYDFLQKVVDTLATVALGTIFYVKESLVCWYTSHIIDFVYKKVTGSADLLTTTECFIQKDSRLLVLRR